MSYTPRLPLKSLLYACVLTLVLVLATPYLLIGAQREHVILRVYFTSHAERDQLLATLPVLEHAVHPEGYVTAYGTPAELARLQSAGYHVSVDEALTAALFGPQPNPFDNGYRTVDEVYTHLADVQTAYPNLVEVRDIGDSWCKANGGCTFPDNSTLAGYDMLAVHLTNRALTGPKPVVFWVVAHHPREIHTTEIALRYIDWMLAQYDHNADITWMLDAHDIWIVPLGNPDGHALVERGGNDPLWQRKNLNTPDSAPWSQCGFPPTAWSQSGVDLNRNHDFHWRGPFGGWESDPCTQTYPGALARGAASEPELQAYTTLATSLLTDQRGPGDEDPAPITTTGIFVSIHSGTEWVLIPYDWRPTPGPNEADLNAVWDKVATWTPGWQSCQTGTCYGIVAGTASDWAYGTFGVPATVWEIGEFMPAYSEIDGYYWPFIRPMMLYTTRIARTPYLEARGPDITGLPLAYTATFGLPLTVTATISDTQTGNATLTGAALYVDVPPWQPSATPYALSAVDGTFNSPLEAATLALDPCALGTGRHTLYLRGHDADGYTGPTFATFAYVPFTCNQLYIPLMLELTPP